MLMLWLGLALLLVVGLAWVVVLLAQLPIWIGLVVSALGVFAFFTVFVVRRLRASIRAAG